MEPRGNNNITENVFQGMESSTKTDKENRKQIKKEMDRSDGMTTLGKRTRKGYWKRSSL